MVNAHLLEVNDAILVLFHLILDGSNLGGQIFLALDEALQHTTGDVTSLLLDNFEVLLNRIKFCLQDLLLHLRRLRYLAELVMRHYHAIIVIILDLVEEIDTVIRRKTFGIGKQCLNLL